MTGRVLMEPHAHTAEVSPCGVLPAAQVITGLKEKGYGAVVITDHYKSGERQDAAAREAFLAGYRAAKAAGDREGIVVLPGLEICFKDQKEDYLVYGLDETDILALPDDACEMGLPAFHDLCRANGWLIYQAHPCRPKLYPASPSFIDGVEIFNGNPRHDSQNRRAAKFASLHTLRTIAGSDIHQTGDVGIVGLRVPADALTPKGFAAWLSATPHPRIEYQETPRDGIRYTIGAVPGKAMLTALYEDAGWTSYTRDMAESLRGIRASSRLVCAWDDTTLVGLARAITDGATILYVQDILVLGTFQRKGIGRELMRLLLSPYRDIRQTVLITDDVPQTSAFYRACGFENIAGYSCAGYIRLR